MKLSGNTDHPTAGHARWAGSHQDTAAGPLDPEAGGR